MCTVVYIPHLGKHFFASLRDEDPQRASTVPRFYQDGKSGFIAPVDPVAGGTWFGVSSFGTVVILLNGAFHDHVKHLTYRRSRGLIVKELLQSAMPVVDWLLMDLDGIEPFTLVVFENEHLFQLVWDGKLKNRLMLDGTKPQIWSSSTLYDQKAKTLRADLFAGWMDKEPAISSDSLLEFFRNVQDDVNGFIMHRNEKLKTLSYTFAALEVTNSVQVKYTDFIHPSVHTIDLSLVSAQPSCDLFNA